MRNPLKKVMAHFITATGDRTLGKISADNMRLSRGAR